MGMCDTGAHPDLFVLFAATGMDFSRADSEPCTHTPRRAFSRHGVWFRPHLTPLPAPWPFWADRRLRRAAALSTARGFSVGRGREPFLSDAFSHIFVHPRAPCRGCLRGAKSGERGMDPDAEKFKAK